jgi:hypothetical protein
MLSNSDDLTPDSLTHLLTDAGVLRGDLVRVKQVQVTPAGAAFLDKPRQVFHLDLAYDGVHDPALPRRLFLKFGSSRKEYFFYQNIASTLDSAILLRCFYTGYDPLTDKTCLLLEDLSATHGQEEWPLPPTDTHCIQTVEQLARMHAVWWNQPQLESQLRPALPPERSWPVRFALAREKLPAFLHFLGERLPSKRRAVLEAVCTAATLWDPLSNNQTLVHGDLHFWNVLFPHSLSDELPRFFDWNMWDIGTPTDDLAYLIALHWYPERRNRLEKLLLEAYHTQLAACGVSGCSREMLWLEYRRSAARALFIPVWQWVRGIHPAVWWPHIERGLLAYQDLDCANVL